jgi:hypothetical protein
MATDLSVAHAMNKPFFIGEAGIRSSETSSLTERANLFDAKIKALFDHGGVAYMPWQYGYSSCSGFDSFCFDSNDPLLAVFKADGGAYYGLASVGAPSSPPTDITLPLVGPIADTPGGQHRPERPSKPPLHAASASRADSPLPHGSLPAARMF